MLLFGLPHYYDRNPRPLEGVKLADDFVTLLPSPVHMSYTPNGWLSQSYLVSWILVICHGNYEVSDIFVAILPRHVPSLCWNAPIQTATLYCFCMLQADVENVVVTFRSSTSGFAAHISCRLMRTSLFHFQGIDARYACHFSDLGEAGAKALRQALGSLAADHDSFHSRNRPREFQVPRLPGTSVVWGQPIAFKTWQVRQYPSIVSFW